MPAALIPDPSVPDLVEIGLLWVLIYLVLRFLRRTIAGGVFRGLGLLLWPVMLGVFLALRELHLEVLGELARGAVPVVLIGLIVVFQTELRHGIARLGQSGLMRRLFRRRTGRSESFRVVDELVAAAFDLKSRNVGALIAIERSIDLSTYVDTGVKIDALIRKELLTSIFNHEAVLHDGAVIVRGDRVAAAACFLPLTERAVDIAYGTRHRAAIGLSEQSDAVVVVTSEERGQVALARRGELTVYNDPRWLVADLSVVFAEKQGLTRSEPPA